MESMFFICLVFSALSPWEYSYLLSQRGYWKDGGIVSIGGLNTVKNTIRRDPAPAASAIWPRISLVRARRAALGLSEGDPAPSRGLLALSLIHKLNRLLFVPKGHGQNSPSIHRWVENIRHIGVLGGRLSVQSSLRGCGGPGRPHSQH